MAKRDIINKSEGLIEARNKARESMNSALTRKLDHLLEWQQSETCHSLVGRWELGKEVDEIYQDMTANGSKVYGANAMSKIKLFMKEDPSMLNQVRRLYAAYPDKKQIQEICEMTMQDQVTHISYSHMRPLLVLETAQQRQAALNLTLENCWTSAELSAHVQKMNGGKKTNNPHGRAAIPKDAETVIAQQLAFTEDFDNRNLRVWKDPKYSVSAQIEKLEPTDYTEDLAKKLGELAHRMRQLATEANARADEAERKFEEVNKALKAGVKIKPLALASSGSDDDAHLPSHPRTAKKARAG